jgi:quinol monooxygenase YgiN
MQLTRRSAIVAAATVSATSPALSADATGASERYGLIGKMKCAPGQRDALISILLEGLSEMPGCLSYVVAKDLVDPDAVWITEAWESREKHRASLSLPSVRAAIAKARPAIVGFGERFETQPVGGHGLVAQ